MSSGRFAAKALLFLVCGFAAACADDGQTDGVTDAPTTSDEGAADDVEGTADLATGTDCLSGITSYDKPGPFTYLQKAFGKVKFWVPKVPTGCKVPVVHVANGTTAKCANYEQVLQRLATHGFLAACYEDPNTGAGTYGITAFDTALREFPDLADKKLGSTGHSQGGQASLVTLQLAEAKYGSSFTYAGLAMEPASGYGKQPSGQTWQKSYGKIRSPVFMFSGNSATGFSNSKLLGMSTGDGLVAISWVKEGFGALNSDIEAYHWTAIGATHIPTPQGPQNEVQIAWFRWKLLGDKGACQYFKSLTSGVRKWKVQKEQNPASCE